MIVNAIHSITEYIDLDFIIIFLCSLRSLNLIPRNQKISTEQNFAVMYVIIVQMMPDHIALIFVHPK
jgi:hypothetical protein